jgi:hypothetical protein
MFVRHLNRKRISKGVQPRITLRSSVGNHVDGRDAEIEIVPAPGLDDVVVAVDV